MAVAEPSTHVRLDSSGVAWLDDTKVKVIEVIVDHLAYGHRPEEIQLQHPHLSRAQVHAAFAYYYDHQRKLDEEIEQRFQRTEALRAKLTPTLSRKKLNARLKRR